MDRAQNNDHFSHGYNQTSSYFPIFQLARALITTSELFQRPDQALFLYISLGDPELFTALHDIGQDGTTEEDHVFTSWRIFDSDLEVLRGRAS